ncbi:MAG: glycine--tRNA ligase subunit beta, partial [bacterium]
MPDLLLEIGAEEIPAGFLPGAITQLKEASEKLLEESGLALGEVKSYASPRRLVLTVRGLAERQPDRIEEVSGPPSRIAFDDQGNPTRAALGFARTSGVSVDQLIKLETPKGEYLGVRLEKKGKETKVILKTLLPELIKALHFPKTMKWGDNDFRFVRPVHWVLAIL